MLIRPTVPDDAPAIARLERLCFSEPWSEATIREELGNPVAYFLTAEADGKPAGYIGMQAVCGEGYIANVAVDPAHRREGIGRALLTALADYARAERFAFLTLEVRESNAPAISLYASLGFRPVGKRPHFYADPDEAALLMTLSFPEQD